MSPRHLAGLVSRFPESAKDFTGLIQFYDAVVPAVGHIDIAVFRESHIGWPVKEPVCFCCSVDSSQNQQHVTGRVQLKHEMASVVGRPKIVVRIDAQTMRVSEESLADRS